MPNWELKKCCNHEKIVFLTTISVCTVVILALWRTVLLMPFKLVTVFIHEASHAVACELTCGHIRSFVLFPEYAGGGSKLMQMKVEVHRHEGVYIGSSCQPDVVSFSYMGHSLSSQLSNIITFLFAYQVKLNTMRFLDLGSSFWGMILILASTNLLTARIGAGCLAIALLIVLFVAKNWTLWGLCIGFIVFLAIIWVLQETTEIRILRHIILFIGVMDNLFSVYDIYDDLISRRVHSSDAEKFAEVCPCPCNGVGWGVIWGFISFLFLCGAMYLGLVILS